MAAPMAYCSNGEGGPRVVWILNHYAGTASSPSTRHFDLARELVARGLHVTIFAAGFNHHKFAEERLAPSESFREERHDGVRFVWLRTFPYRGNEWRRAVNMLTFALGAVKVGRGLQPRPDVIVGSSVHPLAAVAGYLLARLRRSRFFFEVRDLWPETLIDMGGLRRDGPAARFLRLVEKFLYQRAEKVITLLPMAHQYITSVGVPVDKIVWLPNGADMNRYADIAPYTGVRGETFTIMYMGAHGRANALDVVLDCAGILQASRVDSARFVFVGDGAEKMNLQRYAAERGLQNAEFRPPVPKSELFHVMGEADAFVFNLEDLPIFRFGISSNKLFDYLSSGRPVLFSGNAANNPVEEAGAGLSVPARSPEALAAAVRSLMALTPEERIRMGQNGIAYMRSHHDMRLLGRKFEAVLYPDQKRAATATDAEAHF